MKIEFTVYGKPQPQGSAKAFIVGGRARITTANPKMKPWRQEIAGTALSLMNGAAPSLGPIEFRGQFFFDKPKSTKKSVIRKTTKPDVDKILRACLDSLTGIAFKDDSQVVKVNIEKMFGTPERVEIGVYEL